MQKDILQSAGEQAGGPPRANERFCQQASNRYMALLADAGGDPRVAAGLQALRDLKRTGGWAPPLDARDSRVAVKED
jgi:hypothetical protein